MTRTDRPFRWTDQREEAARLVADDRQTDEEIAARLGVSRATLVRWRRHPEFRARVDGLVEEFRAAVRRRGIAQLERRVDALNDRWRRMQQVIEERAAELTDQVAGGSTGLLVRQIKAVGRGEDFQLVEEYVVDAALLRELREHEKQAAQELGQWTDRQEMTLHDDGAVAALDRKLAQLAARLPASGVPGESDGSGGG